MNKKFFTKQLAFCAIISAINILMVLLNLLTPFFALFILIATPFASALITLKCNVKYILIYVISTLLICLLIDFQTTLFHLLPSILSGIFMGFLISKKIHGFYITLLVSLMNVGLELLSFYFIQGIYRISMFEVFQNILNISAEKFFDISLSFLYLFSLIPILLTYFIIEGELPKFHFFVNEDNSLCVPLIITTFILNILSFILVFCFPIIGYLCTTIALLCGVYLLYYLFKGSSLLLKITYYILYTSALVIGFIFSSILKDYGYHLLFNLFSLTTSLNSGIFMIYTCIKGIKICPSLFDKEEETEEY